MKICDKKNAAILKRENGNNKTRYLKSSKAIISAYCATNNDTKVVMSFGSKIKKIFMTLSRVILEFFNPIIYGMGAHLVLFCLFTNRRL